MEELLSTYGSYTAALVVTGLVTCFAKLAIDYILGRPFALVAGNSRIGLSPGPFAYRLKQAQAEFTSNSQALIHSGYSKFKESSFQVQTADLPRVVISLKYLDEIRALPETILSHRQALCDRFLGGAHGLETIRQTHIHSDVCRNQLVQDLAPVLPSIEEELELTVASRIQSKLQQGKATIHAQDTMFAIISSINSRLFLGLPNARNTDWLQASSSFSSDIMSNTQELSRYPFYLRPLVEPFLASTKKVLRGRKTVEKMLEPMIAERKLLRHLKGDPRRQHDMLQWMVDIADERDLEPARMATRLLFLSMATYNANTVSATHALYDLCAQPKLAEELRQEVEEVLSSSQGEWRLSALNSMHKMDAFLKESQRLNGPGLLGFNRKALQEIQLSDGFTIPAGVIITLPVHEITHDKEYWSAPEIFSLDRFKVTKSMTKEEKSKKQFANLDPHILGFGYGRFACPARVYASAQMKLIFGMLLREYRLSFASGNLQRPNNVVWNDMNLPHPSEVNFERIKK